MKTRILLIVLWLLVFKANAQKITISEMIEKSKCETFSEFHTFIVKKGFSYRSLDTVCCGGYLYLFNADKLIDTLNDGYVYGTQCHFFKGNDFNHVSFTTRTKKNYEPILKQLEALKFKVSSERPNSNGNGMSITYKSPSYKNVEVKISLSSEKDRDDNNYTSYYITVLRYTN